MSTDGGSPRVHRWCLSIHASVSRVHLASVSRVHLVASQTVGFARGLCGRAASNLPTTVSSLPVWIESTDRADHSPPPTASRATAVPVQHSTSTQRHRAVELNYADGASGAALPLPAAETPSWEESRGQCPGLVWKKKKEGSSK